MSNKRNRYRRQNYQAKRNPSENGLFAPKETMFATDQFTNELAYIGGASPLLNAGTYERSGLSNNIQKLTVMYRQNWICKRIIDVPSEDMTRAWYTLNSQLSDEKQGELHRLQRHHDIKGQITNAIRWARLYGGSAALIVVQGQEDMLDEPLDLNLLQPGCFRGVIVLDRWMGLEPSMEIEEDMDDVDFGYPKYYNIYLDDMHTEHTRVHHSRLLTFRGRDLPHTEQVNQMYWGASEMEHIYEELQKRDTTSANIAQLVFQANIRTLKMSDFGQILAMGTVSQKRKVLDSIQQQNRLMSNFGLQVLSAEDAFENHPYSFSGLADIYEKFMSDMAGAAEIPATKLYGRSPDGMNATGQSDMTMYYETIEKLQQKHLRPALERLIPIMCISLWGYVPDDFDVAFNPIAAMSPSDQASIGGQITKNVIDAYGAGLIGRKTALIELRQNGAKVGIWTKITDETIEQASDEVEQAGGEQGAQGGMPGMQGMQGAMGAMGAMGATEEAGGAGDPNGQQQTPSEQPKPQAPGKAQQPQNPSKRKMDEQSTEQEKPKTDPKTLRTAQGSEDKQSEDNDMSNAQIIEQLANLIGEQYGQKKPSVQKPIDNKEPSEDQVMKTLVQVAQLIKQEYADKPKKQPDAEQQKEVYEEAGVPKETLADVLKGQKEEQKQLSDSENTAKTDEQETEKLAKMLVQLVNESYGNRQYGQEAQIAQLAQLVNEQYGEKEQVEDVKPAPIRVHDKKENIFKRLFRRRR